MRSLTTEKRFRTTGHTLGTGDQDEKVIHTDQSVGRGRYPGGRTPLSREQTGENESPDPVEGTLPRLSRLPHVCRRVGWVRRRWGHPPGGRGAGTRGHSGVSDRGRGPSLSVVSLRLSCPLGGVGGVWGDVTTVRISVPPTEVLLHTLTFTRSVRGGRSVSREGDPHFVRGSSSNHQGFLPPSTDRPTPRPPRSGSGPESPGVNHVLPRLFLLGCRYLSPSWDDKAVSSLR